MSENVIQMPVPSRPEWLACACGSAWFNTAVTFDSAGNVTGYSVTHAVCRECGMPMPQPTDPTPRDPQARPFVKHAYKPGKFGPQCQVMLARYQCPYGPEDHESTDL